ncbi:MAG: hypothetical protein L6R28_01415 [Planctomycetes bacterium]|nr:hypothetical protein [Planctomycetota bacterium]
MTLEARRLDTPWLCVLIAALLYGGMTVLRLRNLEWDPSRFAYAGGADSDSTQTPPNFHVFTDKNGYDGKYFYRLAVKPFGFGDWEAGVQLRPAVYRHQRILYPLLAHAAVFGQTYYIPHALIGVNLFFVCVLAFLLGGYVRSFGRHALWALPVLLYPGLPITISLDLAEIVALAGVVGGLWAWRAERRWTAAVVFALAALAKEPSLLVAAGVGLHETWRAWRERDRARFFGACRLFVAPAVYLAWVAVLFHMYGARAQYGNTNVAWPFMGYVEFFHSKYFDHVLKHRHQWGSYLFVLGLTAAAAACLWRSQAPGELRWAWGLCLLLTTMLAFPIALSDWGLLRATTEFCALGLLLVAGARGWWRYLVAGFGTWIWLLEAALRIRHL